MAATTIIINGVTHRQACTDGLGPEDLAAYEAAIDRFVSNLRTAAEAEGFVLEFDQHGQDTSSYRVVEEDGRFPAEHEYQRAHEFMQTSVADFWEQYK